MTRRSKLWLVLASLFALFNLVFGVLVAAQGEALHAAAHFALMLLGAYVAWRLRPKAPMQPRPSLRSPANPLEQLQQSVDAVAIEVERIGESQRYNAKLAQERAKTKR